MILTAHGTGTRVAHERSRLAHALTHLSKMEYETPHSP